VRETLDSVFAQTCQDWEVIFWDNASDDGSSEIAASYGDKVRCFRSDTMVPLGTARALAYEQTKGDFVAILDADDIWLPKKLEKQLDLFQSDEGLGMTYCDATFFDQGGDHQRLFRLNQPHRGRVFSRLVRKNFMFSSSMMFRRTVLDELGCAFDDKFTRAQDYDLSLRVAYKYTVDYVDEPLLKWRMAGISDKPWKKALIARAVEVEMSMEGLIESYPEIKEQYAAELDAFYKNLEYNYGVTAWGNGDNAEARRHLSRHLTDKKFATVYLATFLVPRNFFYRVRVALRNLSKGRL
jgi:glycosyltransferase involved in cell wall biosynthesis